LFSSVLNWSTSATGRGSILIRGRVNTEDMRGNREALIVTEIPYQIPKARLVARIAELLLQKKLPLLADVRDESDSEIRLVLEPRPRNVDPHVPMESLFTVVARR